MTDDRQVELKSRKQRGAQKLIYTKAEIQAMAFSDDTALLRKLLIYDIMRRTFEKMPKTAAERVNYSLMVDRWYVAARLIGLDIDRKNASIENINEALEVGPEKIEETPTPVEVKQNKYLDSE